MSTATPLLAAAARLRADADTVATAAERLSELQAACADLHQWAQDNSIGHLPELQARIARVRAALGN